MWIVLMKINKYCILNLEYCGEWKQNNCDILFKKLNRFNRFWPKLYGILFFPQGNNYPVWYCCVFNCKSKFGTMVVVFVLWCWNTFMGPASNYYTHKENSKNIVVSVSGYLIHLCNVI